uniref:Uncharacterized protein n=1 Tax=Haemonchus contortus TaxID=6289 RepID=A0A7I4Y825_HAECO
MVGLEYDAQDTLDFDALLFAYALLFASDKEEQRRTEDEVDEVLRRTESMNEKGGSDIESTSSYSSDASACDLWIFSGRCGPDDVVLSCQEPIDFFEIFLIDEVLELIVRETNRYGTHCVKIFKEPS